MKISVFADEHKIEYELTRKNVKNINLRVKSDGSIAVSAPMRTSVERINDFVISRSDRILAAVDRISNAPKTPDPSTDEIAACMLFIRSEVDRLYPYFAEHGVKYPEIVFKNMSSQWGNCRADKHRLTFSIKLASVSRECISMVVAHEMCHFLHQDHSARFYNELEKLIPNYRELRKQIKK